jgi:tRNA pseudouridine55 synthase
MSLFGLLNLNKPSGVTSRQVVDRVARLAKPAKVGHAGTLDPLASGVLIVGVGQATRLVEYVQQMPKQYRATFLLGQTSTTEDIEGQITVLEGTAPPARTELEQAAATLVGSIMQRPPAFSALKVAGQRAYALARAGHNVELAPRPVEVHRIEIIRYEYPELCLDIECGSGTYVRSLGRDLAEAVGSGAVMSALVRTCIGGFAIETALDPAHLTSETIAGAMLPAVLAVRGHLRERVVSGDEIGRLSHGLSISADHASPDECAAVDARGELIAILARRPDGSFGPAKFFPTA